MLRGAITKLRMQRMRLANAADCHLRGARSLTAQRLRELRPSIGKNDPSG
jgi:hypothetical protein